MYSRLPELVVLSHIQSRSERFTSAIKLNRHNRKTAKRLSYSGVDACRRIGTPVEVLEIKCFPNDTRPYQYVVRCTICNKIGSVDNYWRYDPVKVGDEVIFKDRNDSASEFATVIGLILFMSIGVSAIIIITGNLDHAFNVRLKDAEKNHTYTVGEKAICNTYADPDDGDDDGSTSHERTKIACTIVRHEKTGYYMTRHVHPQDQSKTVQTEERILDIQQIKKD